MTAEVEAVAGRGMDRQVPLRQGGGFEPLQLALASANRDMLRAFGPVAVPLGLDVRDATEPH